MNIKSGIATACAALLTTGLPAANYTWIGGTEGAWNVAANWVEDGSDPAVNKVPSSYQDSATLSCADGDITITCPNGYLEPKLVFATNVTFYVPSGTAYQKGSHSGAGNVTKTGPGKIELKSSSTRVGWLHIDEGTAKVENLTMITAAGGCVVGDGSHEAVLEVNCELSGFTGAKFVINEGGVIAMGSRSIQGFGAVSQVLEISGAGDMTFADSPGSFKLHSATLKLSGERTTTRVLAMRLGSQYQYDSGYNCAKIDVDDSNGLEVDCHLLGALESNWDARDGFDLIGNGTVKLSAASTYGGDVSPGEPGHTRVQAGRLLVDNTEGSGTGYSKVVVSAGATLGGVGFIGGFTEDRSTSDKPAHKTDPCVVVNGAAGNPGVLAPGSYEDTTNARIYGTLTVGSAEQASSVTMGNNTKLAFDVGKTRATGLKVYGPLTLGTGVTLDVNVAENAKSGDYVLVSATEGITGNYTITGNVNPKKVVQIGNEIILHVRNGLTLFVR